MMVTQFLHMEAKAASLLKNGNRTRTSAADEEVLSLEEILAEGMAVRIPNSNTRIRSESNLRMDETKPSALKMDRNKSPATSFGQELNKSQVTTIVCLCISCLDTGPPS